MAEYRHTYFNVRGLGELNRLIFTLAGVKFEDVRVAFNSLEDHPLPADLKQKLPYGQVPYLEVDGVGISQSGTIARFLSRRFGFHGKNDIEAAQIEEIVDAAKDYAEAFWPYMTTKDAKVKEETRKKIVDELTPKYLGKFNQLLTQNGTGFFVGTSISLADIYLFYTFESPIPGLEDLTKGYPAVDQLIKTIGAIPRMKEWMNKRPKTQF